MRITCRCVTVAAGILMLYAGPLFAQVPSAPSARLSKTTTLKCTFSVLATGTWKNGEAVASTRPAKVTVAFNSVDTQDGTADAVGDSGKSHVTVRLVGRYLHFMQVDPYGAMYVTTVFDYEARAGRLAASHTRHEYTPVQLPAFTSRPEQYYGDCVVG